MSLWPCLVAIGLAQEPPSGPPSASPPVPVAFRLTPATDGVGFTSRLALVHDPDGLFITELTLRADAGWRWGSVAAELAGTAARSWDRRSAGLGNLVLDARIRYADGSVANAVGLRGSVAVADRSYASGPVGWWGTVPAATVPTNGIALAADGSGGRWLYHAHLGVKSDPFTAGMMGGTLDFGAGVGTVQPVLPGWSVVGEAELLSTGGHLRALVRRRLWGGGAADLGLAAPLPGLVTDPTLQVLMAVRAGPGGGPRRPGQHP